PLELTGWRRQRGQVSSRLQQRILKTPGAWSLMKVLCPTGNNRAGEGYCLHKCTVPLQRVWKTLVFQGDGGRQHAPGKQAGCCQVRPSVKTVRFAALLHGEAKFTSETSNPSCNLVEKMRIKCYNEDWAERKGPYKL
ncbi:hypothetical protein FQN60_012868, partial [Etheostoma spectabile]